MLQLGRPLITPDFCIIFLQLQTNQKAVNFYERMRENLWSNITAGNEKENNSTKNENKIKEKKIGNSYN